ncbi:MAG: hypothetical protein ABH950_08070 [Candidatus Altiarchaeota archaeon]
MVSMDSESWVDLVRSRGEVTGLLEEILEYKRQKMRSIQVAQDSTNEREVRWGKREK